MQDKNRPLTKKFMAVLDVRIYRILGRIARKRGVTVQEVLRAITVPEWLMQKGYLPSENFTVLRKAVKRVEKSRVPISKRRLQHRR